MSYPESRKKGLKPFQKGQSGNPGGKQPALIPELRSLIEANKEAFRARGLEKLNPKIDAWLDMIIETGSESGDIFKLKMLMEMIMGKMVEDTPDFPVSEQEKALILEYRRRKSLVNE